jgi:hypothetical protein
MSRRNSTIVENAAFVVRFIEACGTSKPAKIARLLNISYQTARNYLDGRLPESYILVYIAEITPYSIHWLLTGEGKKYAKPAEPELPDEIRNFIRYGCVEYIPEEKRDLIRNVCKEIILSIPAEEKTENKEKIVILTSDKIKKENILEEDENLSEREV